jgi:hypothetical protein
VALNSFVETRKGTSEMTYVLPRGLKVIARKGESVRSFKLNAQIMFETDDIVAQSSRDLTFQNGDWTLTAPKKEVDSF